MQVTTIGLDIAKNVLQLDGVDARGRVVLRRGWCERDGVIGRTEAGTPRVGPGSRQDYDHASHATKPLRRGRRPWMDLSQPSVTKVG